MPLVCAGENLNFWPLGSLFRHSGAYFIRRSYAGDPLYRTSLQAYVAKLMADGFFQEFFIEGTRSRTGKLFPAKIGMVRMMVEAYLENPKAREVYLVPTSIDYERVLEEGSYLQEMQGNFKKKERLFDLLRLPKFLKGRYGKVYVQFAKPISIKEALAQFENPDRKLLQSPASFHQFTSLLADQTIHQINRVTTLLPTPLVAMALLHPKQKSITLAEIQKRINTLWQAAQAFQPRSSESLIQDLPKITTEILSQWIKEGRIQGHQDGKEYFYVIAEGERQALNLSMNRGLHTLADVAFVKLIQQAGWQLDSKSTESLRSVLKREFFFSLELQEQLFRTNNLENSSPHWLKDLLLPTIEAYTLSLITLQKMDEEKKLQKVEDWLIIRTILEQGKLWQIKGELKFPESLCRFTLQHALQTWLEMGLLRDHREEMGTQGKKYYSPGLNFSSLPEKLSLLKSLLSFEG